MSPTCDWYNENMTTLVQSIEDTCKKEEAGVSTTGVSTAGVFTAGVSTGGVRVNTAKLTNPAKVPLWTKDMSLETFPNSYKP